MADKYNKIKKKIHPLTWTLLGAFVAAIALLLIFLQPSKSTKFYNDALKAAQTVQASVFTLKEEHSYVIVNDKQLDKAISKDKYVIVFFGSFTNPDTVSFLGVVQKYYNEYDLDKYSKKIYFFDVDKNPTYLTSLHEKYEKLSISTPSLVILKNGEYFSSKVLGTANDEKGYNRTVYDYFKLLTKDLEEKA